jgi:P pilus assembly chaperone PapD
MKKKRLFICIAILLLTFIAVGTAVAQVCVISSVVITGFETKTVTFTNNSEKAETVRVEVKWRNPDGSREWAQPVPAGSTRNKKFTAGTVTYNTPGTIYSIKECF